MKVFKNVVYHGSPFKFNEPQVKENNDENTYPLFFVSENKKYSVNLHYCRPLYLYTFEIVNNPKIFDIQDEDDRNKVLSYFLDKPWLKKSLRILEREFPNALKNSKNGNPYYSQILEYYDVASCIKAADFDGIDTTENISINYGLFYPSEHLKLLDLEEIF